jgi:hypothetical protein
MERTELPHPKFQKTNEGVSGEPLQIDQHKDIVAMSIKTSGCALTPALRERSSSPLPTALTMPEDDAEEHVAAAVRKPDPPGHARSRRPIFFILEVCFETQAGPLSSGIS